ncbi:DUF1653 domain-containing protein [Malaciobacter molluscorum LMG 25693]|uniref:DUF1653 domain-containing protein n=1 Tax=Malaciobacter molluscorum LMG 25693 TaxID=870501 RepID=A0A2G1DHK3_9BACT|nr:DUF1653 domain-containing protein [Malaciobacter molluscorum]AXX93317.1 hypothetical protein AMOL_2375 [Malaciobacter molluscorum LMG 25693]PHO17973.1 DUF1653 domain-containing protein [Malaciobacter molluscorum LMG 25693]RXJ95165.1 DUF1653 domain-containing protein [Malaciobacter molluscorum]
MKEKEIKLHEEYIHYKNLKTYIPVNFCKIQKDDIWVEAIIYKADDQSLYVRDKEEFINKFSLKSE